MHPNEAIYTSSIDEMFMNELIVKYEVATCHYTELCHVIAYIESIESYQF